MIALMRPTESEQKQRIAPLSLDADRIGPGRRGRWIVVAPKEGPADEEARRLGFFCPVPACRRACTHAFDPSGVGSCRSDEPARPGGKYHRPVHLSEGG